jgi:hypothetical protein
MKKLINQSNLKLLHTRQEQLPPQLRLALRPKRERMDKGDIETPEAQVKKIQNRSLHMSDSLWNTRREAACNLVHGDANFIAQHLHKTCAAESDAKNCSPLISSQQSD